MKQAVASEAKKEFSRFAYTYDRLNTIQRKVSATLVSQIPDGTYDTIVDIGCGSGTVYANIMERDISFNHYIALDVSEEMLSLHPSGKKIKKICIDFDSDDFMEKIEIPKNTVIVSSAALQWSQNLDALLHKLASFDTKTYFAIFTANTFATLHQTALVDSPIYSEVYLKQALHRHYHTNDSIKTYTLDFESTQEMLHYIKYSGVNGGEKKLSYKEVKHLIKAYPLPYLEFEVLFVEATSR